MNFKIVTGADLFTIMAVNEKYQKSYVFYTQPKTLKYVTSWLAFNNARSIVSSKIIQILDFNKKTSHEHQAEIKKINKRRKIQLAKLDNKEEDGVINTKYDTQIKNLEYAGQTEIVKYQGMLPNGEDNKKLKRELNINDLRTLADTNVAENVKKINGEREDELWLLNRRNLEAINTKYDKKLEKLNLSKYEPRRKEILSSLLEAESLKNCKLKKTLKEIKDYIDEKQTNKAITLLEGLNIDLLFIFTEEIKKIKIS
jgi:hypothetical protein